MSGSQDAEGRERSTAGPVTGEGGALRAKLSSTPPSPAPPADDAGGAPQGSDAESSPPQGREAGGGDAAQEVEADLEGLLKERDDYLDLAKRTKADFENFRKRMATEVQAAGARGKGELARDAIAAVDDLERAIEAAGLNPDGDSEDALAHGVLLVFRNLRDGLARNGIEAVDPTGEKFDPQWHEALSTVAADGTASGTVVEVLQKGYRLGEQLIRPARVVVSE